jgi:hypothetical protein
LSGHIESISWQDGDDFDVVPGSEFTIARTATRTNTSDYYINDRRVRKQDWHSETLCEHRSHLLFVAGLPQHYELSNGKLFVEHKQQDIFFAKVSTKEVTEKLKGLGVDLDNNRFLILQVRRANRFDRDTRCGSRLTHATWVSAIPICTGLCFTAMCFAAPYTDAKCRTGQFNVSCTAILRNTGRSGTNCNDASKGRGQGRHRAARVFGGWDWRLLPC